VFGLLSLLPGRLAQAGSPSVVCSGNNVIVNWSGTTGAVQVQWSGTSSGKQIFRATSGSYTIPGPGTFQVDIIVISTAAPLHIQFSITCPHGGSNNTHNDWNGDQSSPNFDGRLNSNRPTDLFIIYCISQHFQIYKINAASNGDLYTDHS